MRRWASRAVLGVLLGVAGGAGADPACVSAPSECACTPAGCSCVGPSACAASCDVPCQLTCQVLTNCTFSTTASDAGVVCLGMSTCSLTLGSRSTVACDGYCTITAGDDVSTVCALTCDLTLGDRAVVVCEQWGQCTGQVGAGSQVLCDSLGRCGLLVGDATVVTCSQGDCPITCEGRCRVVCQQGAASCTLSCAVGSPLDCGGNVWACGDCGPWLEPDAGLDAGADGGTGSADGGSDAGSDAGANVLGDGGADAGGPGDGGADAGGPEDGGATTVDAGATPADGGTLRADGGVGAPRALRLGCACESAELGTVALAALALAWRRPSRRRSRAAHQGDRPVSALSGRCRG